MTFIKSALTAAVMLTTVQAFAQAPVAAPATTETKVVTDTAASEAQATVETKTAAASEAKAPAAQ